MKRFSVAVLFSVVAASTLMAQATGWTFDKAHSSINFSIRHMVISEVTGNFKDFSILVNATKDDFTDATIDATIKVVSINTENEQRDSHLKSDDFFNAEKFPEIKFRSTSFEKVSDNKYKIKGDLTMRDVTKSVIFDGVYNGSIKGMRGTTISSWKATISINRFDYGLKWNRTIETGGLIAGDMVNITINLELTKSAS
jgi:polyisoprenoid-binding protein YceI